jgi:hypothetical protein
LTCAAPGKPQAGAAAFLQQGLQGLQRVAGQDPCRRPLGPAATPPSRSGQFVMRFPFLKQLIASGALCLSGPKHLALRKTSMLRLMARTALDP